MYGISSQLYRMVYRCEMTQKNRFPMVVCNFFQVDILSAVGNVEKLPSWSSGERLKWHSTSIYFFIKILRYLIAIQILFSIFEECELCITWNKTPIWLKQIILFHWKRYTANHHKWELLVSIHWTGETWCTNTRNRVDIWMAESQSGLYNVFELGIFVPVGWNCTFLLWFLLLFFTNQEKAMKSRRWKWIVKINLVGRGNNNWLYSVLPHCF